MPQPKKKLQATVKRLEAERAKRSPEEQVAKLNAQFGAGQGAEKERAKLRKVIRAKRAASTEAD